ncbi:MAG: P-aminobenzoate N-oxygenase AurF [Alphaproteobacteria bacterium]|nr:MAG: P-aminobenzoate N-oxygenase AurF [Alphaproteobacteria bacterium]
MHKQLAQRQRLSLLDDAATYKKLEFNKKRNLEQDHSAMMDEATARFKFEDCKNEYWNPEEFSLLHGTPLWYGASPSQRIILNQLYWVAYYAQIVSAEIATIYLNQVSAAGLYAHEDFRIVCDSLDLETKQERAHIHAFKTIGEDVEWRLFGERLFTYPMRSLYEQTMVFADSNHAKDYWRKLQIKAFTLLSSSNAFLASQYLLIRGLRTLNGKMIQHQLSLYYSNHPDKERAPIPSAISYYHFMDESFHFNTSKIIGHDIPRSLDPPTAFEKWIVNRGVTGCQRDHYHFSATLRGIFWYEPALFPVLKKMLMSPHFGFNAKDAQEMLKRCFTQENDGIHAAHAMHRTANESYKSYVESITYLDARNRDMAVMGGNSIAAYLERNARALEKEAA